LWPQGFGSRIPEFGNADAATTGRAAFSSSRFLIPDVFFLILIAYYVSISTFLAMTDVSQLGEFEQVVLLAVLRLGDEAYAVSIGDEILRCTGRAASRGSIYITLDRLETKGYLKSRFGEPTPERGGRAKRFYTLRPRGLAALQESRRALVALWRGLESVLTM
jgi:PadR family transcriptional regulator PadR